jgi:hypothetical protein
MAASSILHQAIDAAPNLSDTSRKVYKATITAMSKKYDAAMLDIIRKPDLFHPRIQLEENIKTRNMYYNTILALIKHTAPLLDTFAPAWQELSKTTKAAVIHDEHHHVATAKQQSAMVPWETVLGLAKKLAKGSMDHLLLTMYIHFTRRQSDFASLRVYTAPGDGLTSSATATSFVHLSPPAPKKPYIHIGTGKTIKHYGAYEEELPQELIDTLKISLKVDPREYVFGNKSPDTFQKWSNSQLKRLFNNKDMCVNILRHSHAAYINHTPNITYAERQKQATRMGHSVMKQLVYDLTNGLSEGSGAGR